MMVKKTSKKLTEAELKKIEEDAKKIIEDVYHHSYILDPKNGPKRVEKHVKKLANDVDKFLKEAREQ